MKATIDEKGMLRVEVETPLESYALRKWVNDNYGCESAIASNNIEFDWSYRKLKEDPDSVNRN